MKKLTFILALGFGLSTTVFAGSPKTDKANTETTTASAKTETKTTTVYYVTALSGGNYTVATEASFGGMPPACTGGPSPCKIQSDHALGTSVPQEDIDDNEDPGITVINHRPQL